MFAISIAFGLANKQKEIAALAGFIGYYTLIASAKLMIDSSFIAYPGNALIGELGLQTINMGAFGGILAGLLGAWVHNKYCELELPAAIAFFGGKRSVAIITIGYATLIGQLLPFIWLPLSNGIHSVGLAISSMGVFGTFLYGFFENLLVPTGLHHIVISIFRTTPVGGVLEIDGQVFEGAWNAFFAGFGKISTNDLGEYTRFLSQSRIPVFVFGFPAVALAMYKTAAESRKRALKPIIIAGTLAVFVTGIQEPLLFLYLFVAPGLFVFNAFMCGVSALLMDVLGVAIGNTQGGIIDLLVYGAFVPGSRWYMAAVVGGIYFAAYYGIFTWYIKKYNITIAPGIGESEDEAGLIKTSSRSEQAALIVEALGGTDNINEAYNCFTRLRVNIKSLENIDEKKLLLTGAVGINKVSETHVQVIYGTKVDVITTAVNDEINRIERETKKSNIVMA